jgi:hypothetical protein
MEAIETEGKCPRCAASPYPALVEERGAPSRTTMDGTDPIVRVCGACREREVFRGSAGLSAIPFDLWPVSLETLIAEDRLRLAHYRREPVTEALRAYWRRERAKSAS